MQRPWPFFPPHPASRQIPSGKAFPEAAEVSSDGAAVSPRARGRRRLSAQPAETHEGKQRDECWDHQGDRRHRTCLKCHTSQLLTLLMKRMTLSQRTTIRMSAPRRTGEVKMSLAALAHPDRIHSCQRPVYGYVPLYVLETF